MQNRLNVFFEPGGDTVQMLKTKEYLEKLGCAVTICCDLNIDLKEYDLVHLFNITRVHETYMQYLNAKEQNKPVVLCPIYQNFDELDQIGSSGMKKYLWKIVSKDTKEAFKTCIRAILCHDLEQALPALKQLQIGFTKQQKIVLTRADRLLPQSELEAKAIAIDFKIDFSYDVAPYAVDHMFFNRDMSFSKATGWQNYVLCVANYIERKNQLALMEAMQGLGIPLILIGAKGLAHKSYYRKIIDLSQKVDYPIKVLEKVEQGQLVSIYSGAKVVALPSWNETCGLACLEGGLAGCNVVITNRGHYKDYLKGMVYFCDPADNGSIREAVSQAYWAKVDNKLKDFIANNFTWEKTAEITKNAYTKVLSRAKK